MLNIAPCNAFVSNRVRNPRPSKPTHPSFSRISVTASRYVISPLVEDVLSRVLFILLLPNAAVCFVVLITRKLFEHVSDTHELHTPISALRNKLRNNSSDESTVGKIVFKKLNVKNHLGKKKLKEKRESR
jgi:hypothetical protein